MWKMKNNIVCSLSFIFHIVVNINIFFAYSSIAVTSSLLYSFFVPGACCMPLWLGERIGAFFVFLYGYHSEMRLVAVYSSYKSIVAINVSANQVLQIIV